ncbi:MAG: hypothetical protein D8M57_02105 [Candidatus Scalindua sp. AMX11]|nr:MAG: hypothetical protein DWQ00_13465 [Candidatus Scalindua sp.]TDE66527.1 MAG: hypothetical protein D8M57_02105 [Candidatus Scalindua sp. AMX11]
MWKYRNAASHVYGKEDVYSSYDSFRIKSEIKLNEHNSNQDLVAGPPDLSAVLQPDALSGGDG